MKNIRQKRTPYSKCSDKKYDDLKKYFYDSEINIDIEKDEATNIINNILPEEMYKSRVWLLFARNSDEEWECVQVAHSKHAVQSEVEYVVNQVFNNEYSTNSSQVCNSMFYENVCPKPDKYGEYRQLLYSKIGSEYIKFKICFLDVDKYLGINLKDGANENDVERIIEICKNQYAEAKIAYQTLAVYWRKVSSAIDGQTISYIVDHMDEYE